MSALEWGLIGAAVLVLVPLVVMLYSTSWDIFKDSDAARAFKEWQNRRAWNKTKKFIERLPEVKTKGE